MNLCKAWLLLVSMMFVSGHVQAEYLGLPNACLLYTSDAADE